MEKRRKAPSAKSKSGEEKGRWEWLTQPLAMILAAVITTAGAVLVAWQIQKPADGGPKAKDDPPTKSPITIVNNNTSNSNSNSGVNTQPAQGKVGRTPFPNKKLVQPLDKFLKDLQARRDAGAEQWAQFCSGYAGATLVVDWTCTVAKDVPKNSQSDNQGFMVVFNSHVTASCFPAAGQERVGLHKGDVLVLESALLDEIRADGELDHSTTLTLNDCYFKQPH
jgi:hypothetical protein